jgi:hypothetical protein
MPRNLRRLVLLTAVVSLCLPPAGCGGRVDKWAAKRPKTYPARGRVLWDGTPEAGVVVSLDSIVHNVTASAITDSSGGFTLKTFMPGDGAVAGEHAVRLEKRVVKDPAAEIPVEVIVLPKKYASPETSGITATVVEKGANQFTFEVTGPRGGGNPQGGGK